MPHRTCVGAQPWLCPGDPQAHVHRLGDLAFRVAIDGVLVGGHRRRRTWVLRRSSPTLVNMMKNYLTGATTWPSWLEDLQRYCKVFRDSSYRKAMMKWCRKNDIAGFQEVGHFRELEERNSGLGAGGRARAATIRGEVLSAGDVRGESSCRA